MLLKEMFSAIGAPREEENDVNWVEDLKFFIDNDSDILSRQLFPAIKKHKEYGSHPDAYKLYIKPIQQCKEQYVTKFEIETPEEKFPKGSLIELAKRFAEEQDQFISSGDYEN
jgi:hypothetical protein